MYLFVITHCVYTFNFVSIYNIDSSVISVMSLLFGKVQLILIFNISFVLLFLATRGQCSFL